MAEKTTEKKTEKEMTKDEFFEAEAKKVKQAQYGAITKGWAIVIFVALFGCFIVTSFLGSIVGIIFEIFFIPVTFFLMMYFVWGPQDVCWASFPREGYTKGVLIGNHLRRFIGVPNGKGYDDEWNIIEEDDPYVSEKNKEFTPLGMHTFWWPFEKIYQEKTEWERWYPNLKKALPRRELLREFTLLPYPYYVEVAEAEDLNRLGVNLYTNVVMRIINPKKALFRQATTWIDIIKPLLQGGYVSYVKATTFQDMLGKGVKDLGAELLLNMPSSNPNKLLKDMIEEVYGIRIESISVLDIVGSDKDEQNAIKAKAVAKLNRDADLIKAGTKAQSGAIDTIGKIIKMLAQMSSETVSIGKDQDQQTKWDEAENKLKTMMITDPVLFEKTYGKQFSICVDLLQRQMALEKGKFADIRTPDNKGGSSSDALTVLLASRLIDTGSGGGSENSGTEKSKKKKANDDDGSDEKMWEDLRNQGLPVDNIR